MPSFPKHLPTSPPVNALRCHLSSSASPELDERPFGMQTPGSKVLLEELIASCAPSAICRSRRSSSWRSHWCPSPLDGIRGSDAMGAMRLPKTVHLWWLMESLPTPPWLKTVVPLTCADCKTPLERLSIVPPVKSSRTLRTWKFRPRFQVFFLSAVSH